MHRLILTALLVVALAVAGAAIVSSTAHASELSVQFGPGVPPGTMTLGGVTGPLSWSGDNWTMTVAGQTFATGTFNPLTRQTTVTSMPGFASCQAGCTTTVSATTLTGQLSITNHGAFVSAVAHWAGANRAALRAAGLSVGGIVSAAARGGAHPTGRSTTTAAPATTTPGTTVGTKTTTTTTTVTRNTSSSTAGGRGSAVSSGNGAGAARGGAGATGGAAVGSTGPEKAGKIDNGDGHGGSSHGR